MTEHPLNIAVIIGSTRQGRFGPVVAEWFAAHARARPDLAVDVVDLVDVELPAVHPSRPVAELDAWRTRLGRADGFVVVTPEYNHGYPAVLKNAIDSIYPEWVNKPVGFVSYGNSGGARAIEQLRLVAIEMRMWPIRSAIHIPTAIYLAVMNEPVPPNLELFNPLKEGRINQVARFFDELLWAAQALTRARGEPQIL